MIAFGTHYLLTIQEHERSRVRAFYQDILGCLRESHDQGVTANIPPHLDLFHFPDGAVLGVQYVSGEGKTLTAAQQRLGCWLEIKSDDVAGLVQKLKAFGVEEITDFWDPEHFYFHAPGGQVFRVIG
ncbi:MAG: VOC family protein [Candidatus Binatia bacterium]